MERQKPAARNPVINVVGKDRIAETEILLDGGPLCVASVWDWDNNERVNGLFFVYLKRGCSGIAFGPFYASISLAGRDMKKALKHFPAGFWRQPLDWYGRQKAFQEWVDKNMGKPGALVGAEWRRD